ncbi:pre-mRNA-splicing regulator WTAP isoform 2-T2 [Menidia menidia]
MAKCRMLIQENQELGRQLSQGRIAQLEAELALQKKYSEELKSSQDELNDFIIQLDEEVEGMQSTILVLQQQLKESRQQLSQPQGALAGAGPSRTSPGASNPSADPSTQPEQVSAPSEPMGKDYGRMANGPSNGSSSQRSETATPSLYREVSSTEEDFAMSPIEAETKLSNHSEEAAASQTASGRAGGPVGFGSQLSAGYESVDSPTGSETSLTQHSNDTDSTTDPHEDKAALVTKGTRTAGSRHGQNGLDSSTSEGAVL